LVIAVEGGEGPVTLWLPSQQGRGTPVRLVGPAENEAFHHDGIHQSKAAQWVVFLSGVLAAGRLVRLRLLVDCGAPATRLPPIGRLLRRSGGDGIH